MKERLLYLVLGLDNQTYKIIGAILVVLCIIAIVKKVVKLAIYLMIVATLWLGSFYVKGNVLESNGIQIVNNQLSIQNEIISLGEIAGFEKINSNSSEIVFAIKTKDGRKVEIKMPVDTAWVLEAVLNK